MDLGVSYYLSGSLTTFGLVLKNVGLQTHLLYRNQGSFTL